MVDAALQVRNGGPDGEEGDDGNHVGSKVEGCTIPSPHKKLAFPKDPTIGI